MGRFQWLERNESDDASQPNVPPPSAISAASLARDYLEQGQQLFADGFYSKALREYSRALSEDNDNIEAWTWQTICQIMMREHEQAYTWASKFVRRFPHEPQALAVLALAASQDPNTQDEVAELERKIEQYRTAESAHIVQFAHTFSLLSFGQNDEAQSALSDFLSSLKTIKEQVFWITLGAAFLLDRRCADAACILLATLDENHCLSSYGMSLYVKAEWLRGQTSQAKKLLKRLRQLDNNAISTYEINDYMERNQPQSASGIRQYLSGLLRFFNDED